MFKEFKPDDVKKPTKRKMGAKITNRSFVLTPTLREKLGPKPVKVNLAWDEEDSIIRISPDKAGDFEVTGRSVTVGGAFCKHFGITYLGKCDAYMEGKDAMIKVPKE